MHKQLSFTHVILFSYSISLVSMIVNRKFPFSFITYQHPLTERKTAAAGESHYQPTDTKKALISTDEQIFFTFLSNRYINLRNQME